MEGIPGVEEECLLQRIVVPGLHCTSSPSLAIITCPPVLSMAVTSGNITMHPQARQQTSLKVMHSVDDTCYFAFGYIEVQDQVEIWRPHFWPYILNNTFFKKIFHSECNPRDT